MKRLSDRLELCSPLAELALSHLAITATFLHSGVREMVPAYHRTSAQCSQSSSDSVHVERRLCIGKEALLDGESFLERTGAI